MFSNAEGSDGISSTGINRFYTRHSGTPPNLGAHADANKHSTGSIPANILFAFNNPNHCHAQHSATALYGSSVFQTRNAASALSRNEGNLTMPTSFLIPAAVFLLCLAIRCTYEHFKNTQKINLENKPIFVFIFTTMCILWISWFTLCPSDPQPLDLPVSIRWLGLTILVAGFIFAVGALIQLRGVENINHLVTTGLFTKFRHPMYMGFISWIVGWSIYHGAFTSMGIGAFGIACVLWWRHLEEGRLVVQFGNSYQQYRLTTWF
jgi:protein-S-isoprenylcysteine O-methyltransferase Ste14